jgi:hypothetical protein
MNAGERLLEAIQELEQSEERLHAFALDVLHDRNCLCQGRGRCVLCRWRMRAAETLGCEYFQVGETGPDNA